MRPSRRAPPTAAIRRDRLDAHRPGRRGVTEQAEPGVEALLRGRLEVAGPLQHRAVGHGRVARAGPVGRVAFVTDCAGRRRGRRPRSRASRRSGRCWSRPSAPRGRPRTRRAAASTGWGWSPGRRRTSRCHRCRPAPRRPRGRPSSAESVDPAHAVAPRKSPVSTVARATVTARARRSTGQGYGSVAAPPESADAQDSCRMPCGRAPRRRRDAGSATAPHPRQWCRDPARRPHRPAPPVAARRAGHRAGGGSGRAALPRVLAARPVAGRRRGLPRGGRLDPHRAPRLRRAHRGARSCCRSPTRRSRPCSPSPWR